MVLTQLLHNRPMWAAVLAWAIAQAIKFILTLAVHKRTDLSRLYGAGGMPSSHTALVMALAVAIGKTTGFDTPLFALAIMMAFVVMYDAMGVRRAAGKQAALINLLVSHTNLPFEETLKELLGHTPLQVVAGACLGIAVGILFV